LRFLKAAGCFSPAAELAALLYTTSLLPERFPIKTILKIVGHSRVSFTSKFKGAFWKAKRRSRQRIYCIMRGGV
jgi:hypothetical protein